MNYTDLPKRKSSLELIEEWVENTLTPKMTKFSSMYSDLAHKADLYDMGTEIVSLYAEIVSWKSLVKKEFTKTKAAESRRIEREAKVGKSVDDKITATQQKAMLDEAMAEWQYYVDVITGSQDALKVIVKFLENSIRAMREDEFMPQGGKIGG